MNNDYTPENVEFDVATENNMPEVLGGVFQNADEAHKFIHENLVAINHSITVNRHMDPYEKKKGREEYQEILEADLPRAENIYAKKAAVTAEAKKEERDAADLVSAYMNQVQSLAKEIKKGLKEIQLKEGETFRIPVNGKYYFYTYNECQLKLCAIRSIPESEKTDIFNQGIDNNKFFNPSEEDEVEIISEKDGEVKSQEG